MIASDALPSDRSSLEVSVVLPSYLEEENLRVLLPRLQKVLASFNLPHEIIVVDTRIALDNTRELCESLGVKHVCREGGDSFGDAVRTGIDESRGKYTIFMDADGSHTPEFIPHLMRYRGPNDVVIASRYIEGGFTENSAILILMSRVLNWSYAFVLGLKCKDVSNSFKLYRSDLLKSLDLYCANFDIIEEILFKLSRVKKDLWIREVPFSFEKRMFGETKRNLLWFVLTYVLTMFRLRLSIFPRFRGRRPARKADPLEKTSTLKS